MIDNYEMKTLKMQEEIDFLIKKITLDEWDGLELHQVEENIFRQVLEIGRRGLELYAAKKGTGKNYFSGKISSHKKENWNYISIFGEIDISRAYFWRSGMNGGIFPIDKDLNLPKKHYSYLLQRWNQMIAVDGNFDKARENINEIFNVNVWSKQSEEINRDAASCAENYYEENPSKKQDQPILVVEADGKGIVMRKDAEKESEIQKKRLGKGEKNNKKKMSTVTAVFGTERNIRTVDDIVKTELDNSDKNPKNQDNKTKNKLKIVKDEGPKPQNKQIRATLKGKEFAFKRVIKEVRNRDPDNQFEHVALMDGERALEQKVKEYLFPLGFILILDLFHVMERLWTLCYFFCKENSKESVIWMNKYLTMILNGNVGYFIGAIRQVVTKRHLSESKKKSIETLLRYFEKRKEYMKYDEYISRGYPIGSGVIEGACRSFVKDRMELAGMRWTEKGAEAMLDLRSIKVNDHWNNFWDFYSQKQKENKYFKHENYYEKYMEKRKKVA